MMMDVDGSIGWKGRDGFLGGWLLSAVLDGRCKIACCYQDVIKVMVSSRSLIVSCWTCPCRN